MEKQIPPSYSRFFFPRSGQLQPQSANGEMLHRLMFKNPSTAGRGDQYESRFLPLLLPSSQKGFFHFGTFLFPLASESVAMPPQHHILSRFFSLFFF
jgi:hypothetical protein